MLLLIWASIILCCYATSDVKKELASENLETCLDHKGKVVSHGDRFFPLGSDPCTQCTCRNGKPETCISVFCSPPENCRQYHALTDKCCEFVCLDRDFPNKGSGNNSYADPDSLNTTNLGLRLVASTVTSFLILALLLFMIHRLRQRRLLLMIRRFHARRMDNGTAHLSRRFSEDDDGSVGYFVGHDHLDFSRYDEPPPPYTLWKPTEMYIPPGEAPPPYDLSVQLTAPFSGNRRYYIGGSNARETLQLQQSSAAATTAAAAAAAATTAAAASTTTTTTAASNVTVASVLPVPIGETSTAFQQVASTSSSGQTSAAVNESESITYVRDRIVLPPDLQYEESNTFTTSVTVNARDIHNTNESGVDTVEQSTSQYEPEPEETDTSAACCTCNEIDTDAKTFNNRHSCSELNDNAVTQLKTSTLSRQKDKVANSANQTPDATMTTTNNNVYPDPTTWTGEVSESSSSSSPTYEQQTPSPSTSDSSFADTEFPRHSRREFVKHCYVASTFPEDSNTPTCSRNSSYQKSRDLVDEDNRTPAFQKTLSNLKRFSLIKRKKKKRLEEKGVEISCSLVCQNLSDAVVLSPQPIPQLRSAEIPLDTKAVEEQNARPMEAINPHIGHKLASSGLKCPRPTTISVSSEIHRPHHGSRHSFYGPLYTPETGGMPLSTVVAIHHRPKTKSRSHSSRASNSDGRSATIHRHGVSSNSSPSSRSGSRITRSGSICSETGERRYHKTNPSSPGNSKHLVEDQELQGHSSKYNYLSRVSMPSELHCAEIPQNSQVSETENTIRTLPVWIVNSESVLPRQDYCNDIASPGILNRCLSTGQIGENLSDSSFCNNLHPALQIRDPSMCDSSWEACSHL